MFRHNTDVAEVGVIEQGDLARDHVDDLVPVSHLSLDLPDQSDWHAYLAGRNIEIVEDAIGRASITAGAARMLIAEERQREQLRQDQLARIEAEVVAADELRQARIFRGIRADDIPVGMSAAQYMMAGDPDLAPQRKSAVAEFLDGDSMTLHPIYGPAQEAS
jgi:hypothetical protein